MVRYKFSWISFGFSLIFSASLFGQAPANDSCMMATMLTIPTTDPFEVCDEFEGDMDQATYDLHTCPGAANNTWWSFVAEGPVATITIENASSTPSIWFAHFTGAPCVNNVSGDTDVLICEESEQLELTDLVPGETYYISVQFSSSGVTKYDVCVQNGPTPSNDSACNPVDIAPGTCASGQNTIGAGFNVFVDCEVSGVNYSDVWYSVTLTDPNSVITVDITNNDFDGDVAVSIHNPPADCDQVQFFLEAVCSDGSTPIDFENLTPGNTYYIRISTPQSESGDFELCIDESAPISCAPNTDCDNAETIPGVVVDGPQVCVDGCNGGMTPFNPGFGTCFDHPNGAAWYTFPATGGSLDLEVNSDFAAPQVAVYTSNDCNVFTLLECSNGANGFVDLANVTLPTGGTVYIAVSDANGDEGDFTLCLDVDRNTEVCTTSSSIRVTARENDAGPVEPITGPYCPGDRVTFCYEVARFEVEAIGCQWLQGIIPTFGDCWDIGVDEEPLVTSPIVSLHGGQWNWHTEGDVDYNLDNPKFLLFRNCNGRLGLCEADESDCMGDPLAPRSGMPPGWYAWKSDGMGASGHPDVDYGDGQGCGYTDGPWEVCFQLTAKSYIDCAAGDCDNISDCSVSVRTVADGETGSWQGGSPCRDDEMSIFSGQLNCTGGPEIMWEFEDPICSGTATGIVLSSFEEGVVFEWYGTSSDGAVSGYGQGQGASINDILTNTGTTIGTVTYHITASVAGGCPSDTTLDIQVLPEPVADAGPDIDEACPGACDRGTPFQIGSSPQDPDLNYMWTGDNTISDPTISDPTVCPDVSTTYTLVVTDQAGCTSSDQVTVFVVPSINPELVGPDSTLCSDPFARALLTVITPSNVTPVSFEWYRDGLYITTTTTPFWNASLRDPGSFVYRVIVTDDHGCVGEAEYTLVVNPTPDIGVDLLSDTICDGGSVDLTIIVHNDFLFVGSPQYHWVDTDGNERFVQTITATKAGWYFYDVTDTGTGCSQQDSVEIFMIPALPYNLVELAECDLGDGTAIFDLTSAEDSINSDPGISFEWFWDSAADSLLPDPTNYRSSTDTVWGVMTKGACVSGSLPLELRVLGLPSLEIHGVDSAYCILSDSDTLYGIPGGGVFSGNGVSSTGVFDPSLAGVGLTKAYYQYTDSLGCSNIDSVELLVVEPKTPVLFASEDTVCITGDRVVITSDLAGGIYTGNGIVDSIGGIFDPSIAGLGLHTIYYNRLDTCPEEATITLWVLDTLAPPVLSCGRSTPDSVEFTWAHPLSTSFIITVTHNGTILIDGRMTMDNSVIIDNLSANDVVRIEVVAVGDLPCGNSSPAILECQSEPCPVVDISLSANQVVCIADEQIQISAVPSGGAFHGNGIMDTATGTFDPALAGLGTHTIEYILRRPGACEYTDFIDIMVEDTLSPPVVNCVLVSLDSVSFAWSYTDGATEVVLSTWVNGIPDIVDLRTSQSSYTKRNLNEDDIVSVELYFVGINACGDSRPGRAECQALKCDENPPNIDPVAPLCVTDNTVLLSANPSGGVFSGNGLTDNEFDPRLAGVGTHQISYSYIDEIGCPQINFIDISVEDTLAPPQINCSRTTVTSVEVSWTHPLASNFILSYSINGGPMMTLNTNENQFEQTGLNEGDSVQFWLVAVGINSCGDSNPSTVTCVAEDCPPSPISLDGNRTSFCVTDNPYQIIATPMNASSVFSSSSAGLSSNGVFDPSIAGVGTHTIHYMLDDGAICEWMDSVVFEVYDLIAPPVVSCVEQRLDQIRFEWTGAVDAEYLIYYRINGGPLQGPIASSDKFYTVTGLREFDEVEIYVEIVNDTPCGNSVPGEASCIALNCDIVISGLLSEIVICDFEPVFLNPQISGSGSSYDFVWTLPDGTTSTQSTIMVIDEGNYTLEVMDERGCFAQTSFSVRLDPLIPLISISDPSCFGKNDGFIRIDAISGGQPEYEISINGEAFSSQRHYTGLGADDYIIQIRDQNGCAWTDTLMISDPEEFLFQIDTTQVIQYGDSLIYLVEVDERTDSLVTFKLWLTSDPNVECVTCWDLKSLPLYTGNYLLNVQTINGCPAEGIVRAIIEHDRTVYIPNIFNPRSSEADNAIFRIFVSEEVEQVEGMKIFDRWGNMVFDSGRAFDPRVEVVGWDGRFNGQPLAPAVFVYWIKIRYTDGTRAFFKGDITLMR